MEELLAALFYIRKKLCYGPNSVLSRNSIAMVMANKPPKCIYFNNSFTWNQANENRHFKFS